MDEYMGKCALLLSGRKYGHHRQTSGPGMKDRKMQSEEKYLDEKVNLCYLIKDKSIEDI